MTAFWTRIGELVYDLGRSWPRMRPAIVGDVVCDEDASIVVTVDDAGVARRFDLDERTQRRIHGRVHHAAIDDLGNLISVDSAGAERRYDQTGSQIGDATPAPTTHGQVVAVAYDCTQAVVAWQSDDGLSIQRGDLIQELAETGDAPPLHPRLSCDGGLLIAHHEGEVKVWDTVDGTVQVHAPPERPCPPDALAVARTADTSIVALAAFGDIVDVATWSGAGGGCVWSEWDESGDAAALALDATGTTRVTANRSGIVRAWREGVDDGLPRIGLPRRHSLTAIAVIAFACWWVLRALDEILRDLHLPGSPGAYGASDVLAPGGSANDIVNRLRVWHDWDVSRRLTGQPVTSLSVVWAYTVIDILFAVLLGLLLAAVARARWRIRRSDPTRRGQAVTGILTAAAVGALVYIVFDVVEDVSFLRAVQAEPDRASSLATLTFLASVGKWSTLAVVVVAIASSFVFDAQGRTCRRRARLSRPRVVPTLLDLRAQTLAAGLVVAALLLLPGNVRPQMLDLVRGWTWQQWCITIGCVLLLCVMLLVTGVRVVERVDACPSTGLESDRGPFSPSGEPSVRRRIVVGVVMLAFGGLGLVLLRRVGDGTTMFVIAGLLALWSVALFVDRIRKIGPNRPKYRPYIAAARFVCFLPAFAFTLIVAQAQLPVLWQQPSRVWLIVIGAGASVVVAALAHLPSIHTLGSITARVLGTAPSAPPQYQAPSTTVRQVAVPLVVAGLAVLGVNLADSRRLGSPWTYGAVALIVLLGIVVLGVYAAATTLAFTPPRSLFALIGLRRLPVITLPLLVLAIVSFVSTRPGFHNADLTADEHPDGRTAPTTVSAAFEQWATLQQVDKTAPPPGRSWTPLVIVSAAGGGGRAAFWTYLALDCLFLGSRSGATPTLSGQPACTGTTDAAPDLGDVFAISGISGGSVGAAMFVAAAGTGAPPPHIDDVFARGFVDPVVSNMLVRDIPNAWLQVSTLADRAERLESEWERQVPALSANFFEPIASTGAWRPQLILNSASVHDGCRVVVANLAVAVDTRTQPATSADLSGSCRSLIAQRLAKPPTPQPVLPSGAADSDIDTAANPWPATRDLDSLLCPTDNMAISTAALLSARFPYVSPSGAVTTCGTDTSVYLVDGGTVDSSAAAPAALLLEEVVRLARSWNDRHPTLPCVQPVVLQIDNGYEDIVATSSVDKPSELLAPLQGGLSAITSNADTARQELAVAAARLGARSGCAAPAALPTFLQIFPQSHPGVEAPLGWSLSGAARTDMEQQMSAPANQCTLMALRYWLTADAGAGSCFVGTVADSVSGTAVAGKNVCFNGGRRATSTNAYGVFVLVTDSRPLPPNDQLVCDSSDLTNAGDGFGPADGSIRVDVPFTSASEVAVESNGWSAAGWVGGVLFVITVLAIWFLVTRHINGLPAPIPGVSGRRRS